MARHRLVGPQLFAFLASHGVPLWPPLGRMSATGTHLDDHALETLLHVGDAMVPVPGRLPEDNASVQALLLRAGSQACLPLTPDGHLGSSEPLLFDPVRAAENV